jgi:hypothetical protein
MSKEKTDWKSAALSDPLSGKGTYVKMLASFRRLRLMRRPAFILGVRVLEKEKEDYAGNLFICGTDEEKEKARSLAEAMKEKSKPFSRYEKDIFFISNTFFAVLGSRKAALGLMNEISKLQECRDLPTLRYFAEANPKIKKDSKAMSEAIDRVWRGMYKIPAREYVPKAKSKKAKTKAQKTQPEKQKEAGR